MPVTETDVRDALSQVTDPRNDDDIVSLELVNEIKVDDGTAIVSLAFNTPYAPTEMELGNEIRDAIVDLGLDPDLRARADSDSGFDDEVMPNVKNVIAVASGKGGVGKTTVAANLAAGLNQLGARVGILDADVHGPNVPRLLPLDTEPLISPNEQVVPGDSQGVSVMSTDYLLDGDDPAILRGPMVNQVMMDFIENVDWGQLDYLIVDLPPGTGDASLNLLQALPVAGVVIVTTPQEMAVADARKGLKLFEKHHVPVLGVVENMSGFHCPNCDDVHAVFGSGDAQTICEDFDVPLLAQLPVHEGFDSERVAGPAIRDEENPMRERLETMTEDVTDRLGEVNRQKPTETHEDQMGEEMPGADTRGPACSQ